MNIVCCSVSQNKSLACNNILSHDYHSSLTTLQHYILSNITALVQSALKAMNIFYLCILRAIFCKKKYIYLYIYIFWRQVPEDKSNPDKVNHEASKQDESNHRDVCIHWWRSSYFISSRLSSSSSCVGVVILQCLLLLISCCYDWDQFYHNIVIS